MSSFYHHFEAVAVMSPVQFQNRRAPRCSVRWPCVGYDDASYFTREYKRRAKEPPLRDLERLREVALERAGQGTGLSTRASGGKVVNSPSSAPYSR